MAANPETKLTNRVRTRLVELGAVFIKISDSYTRGIPDALVCITRLVLIEFKIDRLVGDPPQRTWRSLGLSGAQDHFIKAFTSRERDSAFVVTDTRDGGKLRAWIPVRPEDETSEHYECIAKGDEVYDWLT